MRARACLPCTPLRWARRPPSCTPKGGGRQSSAPTRSVERHAPHRCAHGTVPPRSLRYRARSKGGRAHRHGLAASGMAHQTGGVEGAVLLSYRARRGREHLCNAIPTPNVDRARCPPAKRGHRRATPWAVCGRPRPSRRVRVTRPRMRARDRRVSRRWTRGDHPRLPRASAAPAAPASPV